MKFTANTPSNDVAEHCDAHPRDLRFNAYCALQEIAQGQRPSKGTYVYGDGVSHGLSRAFDHAFGVWRLCLWSPFPELRCGSDEVAEFGIIGEPYSFDGTPAQQAVAEHWGFKFYRLPNAGFHHPGMTSFLWVVRDIAKAGAVVQAMLPDWKISDLYGLAPVGQQMTIVSERDAHAACAGFNDELDAAGRSAA